jgi:hypothetical protein
MSESGPICTAKRTLLSPRPVQEARRREHLRLIPAVRVKIRISAIVVLFMFSDRFEWDSASNNWDSASWNCSSPIHLNSVRSDNTV